MTPTSPPQDETPLNQPGQPCRTPQAVGNRTCCVHCGFFLSQHVAPDETPQGDPLARAELPCDACVLCRARKCLEELRKRAEAAEAEIARLTKMRTHCSNCGGDYLATGVEVGCPCLVLARAEAAEAALKEAREELEKAQKERTEPVVTAASTHRCICGTSFEPLTASDGCPSCGQQVADAACEHGTAMDVHCCNCHSGFLFDAESCVCR